MKSSSSNIQSQAPTQALQPQPAGAAPTAVSPVSTMMMSRFHWYHAVLAVGLLAASGAGTAVFIKVTTDNLCFTFFVNCNQMY